MEQGYHKILWGLFITIVHIDFFVIPIFPAFVGWLFIYQGAYELYMQNKLKGFREARNYALILIFITLLSQLLSWMRVNNDMVPYLAIGVFFFQLLFIYALYEGSIKYLRMMGDHDNAEHYIRVQRAFIILFVIETLMACAALTLADPFLNVCTAIFGIILMISFMISIRTIKNTKLPSIDITV